jgi:hypothetical protein
MSLFFRHQIHGLVDEEELSQMKTSFLGVDQIVVSLSYYYCFPILAFGWELFFRMWNEGNLGKEYVS